MRTRIVAIAMACAFAAALAASTSAAESPETVRLHTLDLSLMQQGWGQPQIDRGIRGLPLSIGGRKFEYGVGTHAKSDFWIDLAGGTERFLASVGVDDAADGKASITFMIVGDGKTLWESGGMKEGDPPKTVDVDLKGVKILRLRVGDAGDGISHDHANWADARFLVTGVRPAAIELPQEKAAILTPKPPLTPRINGPKVYGCRPGNPFLYRIPATGERPMQFAASNLPAGLSLDPQTGILSGSLRERGETAVLLKATNKHGVAERTFKIVCGDTLALTPPMGWNDWYAHYEGVTDPMMREAADLMITTGMADMGYQYVNIDDCWMNAPDKKAPGRVGPLRDDQGNILPNKYFPDMTAMTDYIHSKGLKAGIYTSPGPLTCAGYSGSYQHEAQDARRFADWGFDFVKYDWCSYSGIAKGDKSLETLQKPYRQMGELLKQQKRDIVFNLCQYGMGNVWEWGEEVDGHCWRTAGDLGFELDRIFEVAIANASHRAYNHPGSWNDPDYLQIGFVGKVDAKGNPKRFPLTPNEQYAFMSMWCLMAAPLVYSGDMSRLDEFTLNVLCNPEVIEVDQDPLGLCAEVITLTPDTFVMVKAMEDGSKAVGLCNRGESDASIAATWSTLGITGKHTVRDLWRQKDLGQFETEFKTDVPHRGVALVRLWPVAQKR